jgi:hypothetical protein
MAAMDEHGASFDEQYHLPTYNDFPVRYVQLPEGIVEIMIKYLQDMPY